MAYTKTLFTLTALATELGRDRRTIGKALAAIPPEGRTSGYDGWHLSTALAALERHEGRSGRRSGDDADDEPNPVDAAMLMASAELLRSLGPITAEAAIEAGLTMEKARALVEAVRAEMIGATERFLRRVDALPGSRRLDWRGLGAFMEPDWSALARAA